MNIRIFGTGSYIPDRVLTNADLEKMVDTSDEWIVTRTGIHERRICRPDETSSSMGSIAGRRALESAGVDGRELAAIIVATSTPDYVFPSTAALIQRELGAGYSLCFDLSSACTGLISALMVAYNMLAGNPHYKHILVCGAEKLSCVTNWEDRNTCILFGDGASAILLSRDEGDDPDGSNLLASELRADGTYAQTLILPGGGSKNPASAETVAAKLHTIHMAGRETFKLAVNAMYEAADIVMNRAGVKRSDVKLVIPHQANLRIIDAVAKRLGFSQDQLYINIDRCGNTSAASIGICLDEAVRSGRLKRGDLLLLASFGSGLTWGSLLIRY